MNESKNQLDQIWNQIETAKKEYSKIIIKGLSDNDSKEVSFAFRLIEDELIPALELDRSESKRLSLNTLNALINERRPPKNESELNDLENAAFFKLVKDTQKKVASEENKTLREEFLKTKNISIEQLKQQFEGRRFGEIILHHIKVQTPKQINDSIIEFRGNIYPALAITTDKFLETLVYSYATTKEFWKIDCGKAITVYITATKAEAKKYNIEVSDDYAFDIFNLIVLSLAQRAINDINFYNIIKNSIKKYWLF